MIREEKSYGRAGVRNRPARTVPTASISLWYRTLRCNPFYNWVDSARKSNEIIFFLLRAFSHGKKVSVFLNYWHRARNSNLMKWRFVSSYMWSMLNLLPRTVGADRVFAIIYKIAKMTWQCLRLMQIPVSCKFPRRASRDRQSSIFYDARTYNADKRP